MISLQEMGQRACEAKYSLQKMTAEQKNQALLAAAKALREEAEDILSANRENGGAPRYSGGISLPEPADGGIHLGRGAGADSGTGRSHRAGHGDL